jgi:hypothetical protein
LGFKVKGLRFTVYGLEVFKGFHGLRLWVLGFRDYLFPSAAKADIGVGTDAGG